MSKKLLSVLLLVFSIIALVVMMHSSTGQQRLSQLYVSSDTWDELIAARQPFEPLQFQTTLFGEVYFNGYPLAVDLREGMLLYSMIEDDPQAYDPFVRVTPGHILAKVAVMGGEITDEMIRNNEAIRIMIYTPNYYSIFDLRCTTLPIIEVETAPWDIHWEDTPTKVRIFDNRKGVVNRTITSAASIHVRGGVSRSYHKNGYKLALKTESAGNNFRNRHVSLLGLRQDDDWVLNCLYSDRDKVRDVFSTNLWYASSANRNEFGVVNGTQYRYVEAFYGENYWGIYAICSPIDEKQIELTDGEHMYRKINPYAIETEIDFETRGVEIDGYEYRAGNLENPDWEPLRSYYHTLLSLSPDIGETLYTLADVENAIDLFLFLNMVQGIDHANLRGKNAIYNQFLTAKKTPEGTLKMLFTPWDMDNTWGMVFGNLEMDPSANVIMETNLVARLMELGDEDIVKRTIDRYWELRDSVWSEEYMENMILDLETKVFDSGAYERDYMMFHQGKESSQEIRYSEFINYVYDRLWYMDDYIDNLAYEWGF